MHPFNVPVGTVLPYAGPIAEADKPAQIKANLASVGWLLCDGGSLHRKEYPHLYGVIGAAFGSDADDTFNLPDLRGRFFRGVDVQTGDRRKPGDPDAAQRLASAAGGNTGNRVGSLELDAFQGHEHKYRAVKEVGGVQASEAPPHLILDPEPQSTTSDVADEAGDGAPRFSSETRPVNLYLNFIIRYR